MNKQQPIHISRLINILAMYNLKINNNSQAKIHNEIVMSNDKIDINLFNGIVHMSPTFDRIITAYAEYDIQKYSYSDEDIFKLIDDIK